MAKDSSYNESGKGCSQKKRVKSSNAKLSQSCLFRKTMMIEPIDKNHIF